MKMIPKIERPHSKPVGYRLVLLVLSGALSIVCSDSPTDEACTVRGQFVVYYVESTAFWRYNLIVLKASDGASFYVLSEEEGSASPPSSLYVPLTEESRCALTLYRMDSVPQVTAPGFHTGSVYVDSQVVWHDGKLLVDAAYICKEIFDDFVRADAVIRDSE